MDRDTITALTIAVRVYRRLRAMGVYDMPVKWNIAGKAMKARGIMDQISAEYDAFASDGSEHLGDIKGLRTQLGEMKDDLYAAANVMGNGSGAGSDSQGSPPVSQTAAPAVQQPEQPKPAPAITPESPGNISPETHTRDSNGTVIEK